MTDDGTFDLFIELSSALTGYDLRHDPWAMDVAETYLEKVLTEKGADALKQVLDTYSGCVTEGAGDQDRLKGLMSARLMTGSGTVPDLARSILWLWYLSAWYDKPEIKPWPDIYPPKGGEIVPGQAYTRGLAFKESHPIRRPTPRGGTASGGSLRLRTRAPSTRLPTPEPPETPADPVRSDHVIDRPGVRRRHRRRWRGGLPRRARAVRRRLRRAGSGGRPDPHGPGPEQVHPEVLRGGSQEHQCALSALSRRTAARRAVRPVLSRPQHRGRRPER